MSVANDRRRTACLALPIGATAGARTLTSLAARSAWTGLPRPLHAPADSPAQALLSVSMAATSASADPPYYVLISHSQSLASPAPASSSLCHPIIEYHYADDPPASLLPQHPAEHVLVLDYEPAQSGLAAPTVKSLSPALIVSALKVTDAPGAAVAGEPALRNNSMYVIETTTRSTDMFVPFSRAEPSVPCLTGVRSPTGDDDEQPVHAVLSRFKQRSVVIAILAHLVAHFSALPETLH